MKPRRSSAPATARKKLSTARKKAAPRKKPAAPAKETAAARQARAARLLTVLQATYPGATTALRHGSAYELLVATILSAQCTDQRINQLTPEVFSRYPDAAALAAADPQELETVIRPAGFFRNKAKSLLGMARRVHDDFGGLIPDRMDDLLTLPGVARKTANCVLGTWYRKNEGVVVDTHVGRVALRLGLSPSARNSKDAERIERDLMATFPQDAWTFVAHAMIHHGRTTCTARQPRCSTCVLAGDCPSAGRV